ncbi:MAG: hypothetical protein Q8P30_00905 [Candidatus Uhrbacteria bacterium]|nr:hypothetical protein [Candidatus Uhrbacteria bacterium]
MNVKSKLDSEALILFGNFLFLIGVLISFISGPGWSLTTPVLVTCIAIWLPVLAIKACRRFKLTELVNHQCTSLLYTSRLKKRLVMQRLQGYGTRFQNWYSTREQAILPQAKWRAEYLCSLITGPGWLTEREHINQIAHSKLPELLERRRSLKDKGRRVGEIIAKYRSKDIDDFARQLLDKSIGDKQTLETLLAETKQQIRDCVTFLDHIESDLIVAVEEGSGLGELRENFYSLSARIEASEQSLTKAHKEVKNLPTIVALARRREKEPR